MDLFRAVGLAVEGGRGVPGARTPAQVAQAMANLPNLLQRAREMAEERRKAARALLEGVQRDLFLDLDAALPGDPASLTRGEAEDGPEARTAAARGPDGRIRRRVAPGPDGTFAGNAVLARCSRSGRAPRPTRDGIVIAPRDTAFLGKPLPRLRPGDLVALGTFDNRAALLARVVALRGPEDIAAEVDAVLLPDRQQMIRFCRESGALTECWGPKGVVPRENILHSGIYVRASGGPVARAAQEGRTVSGTLARLSAAMPPLVPGSEPAAFAPPDPFTPDEFRLRAAEAAARAAEAEVRAPAGAMA